MRGLVFSLPKVIRKRSLGPAGDFLGEQFTLRINGRRLELAGASFGIVREIFGHQAYIASTELSDAHCIVDLGANCGIFTLYALLNAPRSRVHAVEAQPKLAAVLHSNLYNNRLAERVVVHNALVGAPHDEWSRLFAATHPEVPQCDVGMLIESLGVCDFLKCDIEGAEFQIFTTEATWLRHIRRLALEYHGPPARGIELEQILCRHGFQVTRRDHASLGYLDCIRAK